MPEILNLFWGMFAILGGVVLILGIAMFAWTRFRASGQEKGI
jgi:F0F1-type ATP synthase assembly protein I